MTQNKRTVEPWDCQDGESWQAFEAFVSYRDMGSVRSHAKVAVQLGKSIALMNRWASRWSWANRLTEYDRFLDRQIVTSNAELLREANTRHLRLGQMMLAKYLERISSLSAAEIPVTVLDRFLKQGIDAELNALGAPQATTRLEHTGLDGAPLLLREPVAVIEFVDPPEAEPMEIVPDDDAEDTTP